MFDNSYKKLPEKFYQIINPEPVRKPELALFNDELAKDLGFDKNILSAEILAGNELLEGSEPLAQAYAGHQFGNFVPQLGDGRAILLGEVTDSKQEKKDIQLKGSGLTKFSRGGDGRAALGPMIREYIISEAMHTLNIPTTRSLAVVRTGEEVLRNEKLDGAILTRIASSHIRVGTFEYYAAQEDLESVQTLADYSINRHYPELNEHEDKYYEFFKAVAEKQVKLVAKWMGIGFIHGVMNTDNCTISGETIDYGPCAFMDYYNPATVFSSIDQYGRYAYQAQGDIVLWNMMCFARTLLKLFDNDIEMAVDKANQALEDSQAKFKVAYLKVFCRKLSLEITEDKHPLIMELLQLLEQNRVDFTTFFAKLSWQEDTECLFTNKEGYREWFSKWDSIKDETKLEEMKAVNPIYIPRNHIVENLIETAETNGDYQPAIELLEVMKNPFSPQEGKEKFAQANPDKEFSYQTFCGT